MRISKNGSQWVDINHEMDMTDILLPTTALVKERTEKYSSLFGDVSLTRIILPDIYIAYGDIAFRHPRLHFRASDMPDMVELHFSLAGSGIVHNNVTNQDYLFEPAMQNMVYMPHIDGVGEFAQKNCRFFEIHFTRERFLSLVNDCGGALQLFADDIAAGRYTQLSEQNIPISFAMHSCIQDIMNCPFTGGLKLIFLQSKCIELLVLQAEAFTQYITHKKQSVLKSAHDKECIYRAQEYLLQHADAPPSLSELAKRCGTNEFKLKNGFRELFQNSVFGYLNEYRLSQAKELLLSGAPIKQVAMDLGYSSTQHFCTAFKKKYGTTPGNV